VSCTSHEIGYEDRLLNDLYCVKGTLNPTQLNLVVGQKVEQGTTVF